MSPLSAMIMLDLLKVVTDLDQLLVLEASTSSITFGITGHSSEAPTLGSTLMGSRYKLVIEWGFFTSGESSIIFTFLATMDGEEEVLTL